MSRKFEINEVGILFFLKFYLKNGSCATVTDVVPSLFFFVRYIVGQFCYCWEAILFAKFWFAYRLVRLGNVYGLWVGFNN